MMKILVSGDWHLDNSKIGRIDPETDLDLRIKDSFLAIDYMIDYAIGNHIDLFLLNGDLFRGRTSTHHIETLVANRFHKIAAHMDFKIIMGNHDYTPKLLEYGTHTYSIIEKAFPVYIDITHLTYPGVDIILYPYHDLGRTTFSSNEELISWISEKVSSFTLTQPCKLFIGHGTPQGTLINEDWFVDLELINEPILPQSLFDSFDMALFSHIHRQHFVTPKVFHIGSPERVDFAEALDDKGFVVYDTDTKTMEWISTNPRPMLDLKISLLDIDEFTDPTEALISKLQEYAIENAMVKVEVELAELALKQVDHTRIREYLKKAFWVKGPRYETPTTKKSRNSELTEQLTPLEALEKVLEGKEDLSDHERKQFTLRAKRILQINEAQIS